ncbi:cytochrome P450 [Actinomadura scrupuli]|uniref:cytochrome P450 n=1 Tax=Actinomadura scrupuli TaxID=559629 RepID=UPI003D97FF6F
MVQLNIGLFRLYIATHPDHVQHVFRDNSANYLREGMMWRPMRRLIGNGLAGEGPVWESRRSLFRPMFSARSVTRLTDAMVEAITQSLDDDLDPYAASGRPLDVQDEMTRVVHRVFRRVFLGDGISMRQTEMLGTAVDDHLGGLGARMLLPFVPHWCPMPGDRAYRRAQRTVDAILLPLIRERRASAAEGRDDVVSVLCRAGELDDRQIRDDVIASFAAATETTALSLTWLWVLLESHPDVAARLTGEVGEVVGAGPVEAGHLPRLTYTKMVLQELIRLYPAGWIIPRTAAGSDTVGGVAIKGGSTVLISPYLMHRLADFWERPHDFDPGRFDPGRLASGRQKGQGFSYLPFGAGPHTCLGSHLFTAEAQLIVAALLSRYRPRLIGSEPVRPRPRAALHPSRRLEMILERADG